MTDSNATDAIFLACRRATSLLEGYGYTFGDQISEEHWTEAALEVLTTAENLDHHWFDEFLHPIANDRLGLAVNLRIHSRLYRTNYSAPATQITETLLDWVRSWADHVLRDAVQRLPRSPDAIQSAGDSK